MKHIIRIKKILEQSSDEVINKILDKISDEGIESLSDEEKQILQNYGQDTTEETQDDSIVEDEVDWNLRDDLFKLCTEHQIYDLKNTGHNYWILSFESNNQVAQDIRQLLFKYHNKIRVQQSKKEYIDLIDIILPEKDAMWLDQQLY